jgi:hypothetical protein
LRAIVRVIVEDQGVRYGARKALPMNGRPSVPLNTCEAVPAMPKQWPPSIAPLKASRVASAASVGMHGPVRFVHASLPNMARMSSAVKLTGSSKGTSKKIVLARFGVDSPLSV